MTVLCLDVVYMQVNEVCFSIFSLVGYDGVRTDIDGVLNKQVKYLFPHLEAHFIYGASPIVL